MCVCVYVCVSFRVSVCVCVCVDVLVGAAAEAPAQALALFFRAAALGVSSSTVGGAPPSHGDCRIIARPNSSATTLTIMAPPTMLTATTSANTSTCFTSSSDIHKFTLCQTT